MTARAANAGVKCKSLGNERGRRRAESGEEDTAFVGKILDELSGETEESTALVGAEQEQAEMGPSDPRRGV